MDVLKTLAMLEALKWKMFKYGKIEELQAQVEFTEFIFVLSIGTPYY